MNECNTGMMMMQKTRGGGDAETRRVRTLLRIPASPCPHVPVSPCLHVPASPRPRVPASPWLKKTLGLAVLFALILGIAHPGYAQQTPKEIDPEANQLLQKLSQSLQKAQKFTFEADTTSEQTTRSGQKIQYSTDLKAAVSRPSGLRAESEGDTVKRGFWYNGQSMTLLDRFLNVYSTVSAPATIDAALDTAESQFRISNPLSELVVSDPYQVLTANVETGAYLGLHFVRGKLCHHLAFTQANVDWQIWLEDSARSVPCKMVITYKNLPGVPQYTAVFTNWNFNPTLTGSTFTFQPPANARKLEMLPSASAP